MKIAFYAPLKSPDHLVPSGDRQMARALIKALALAGHEVELVSNLRCFSKTPHDTKTRDEAIREAERIVDGWAGNVPDVWFSYHPYYKAPDLLALEVLKSNYLPVITVEASLSKKRDLDGWAQSQDNVRALLQQSKANFYFTDRDLPGLESIVETKNLIKLPPFIDTEAINTIESYRDRKSFLSEDEPAQLVTMGMMREGVKIDSYALLAASLKNISQADWHLTIIGDGEKRPLVEDLFASFPSRQITWCGEIEPSKVSGVLANGDIFVWPGFGEAYGLAYLEAQAVSLPVVAQSTHGVPYVVKNGETGILVAPNDSDAYSNALRKLINDEPLRRKLGRNARQFILNERNLATASDILNKAIGQII